MAHTWDRLFFPHLLQILTNLCRLVCICAYISPNRCLTSLRLHSIISSQASKRSKRFVDLSIFCWNGLLTESTEISRISRSPGARKGWRSDVPWTTPTHRPATREGAKTLRIIINSLYIHRSSLAIPWIVINLLLFTHSLYSDRQTYMYTYISYFQSVHYISSAPLFISTILIISCRHSSMLHNV